MTFQEWWSHQQTLESFCPVSVARTIWDAAQLAMRERAEKVAKLHVESPEDCAQAIHSLQPE